MNLSSLRVGPTDVQVWTSAGGGGVASLWSPTGIFHAPAHGVHVRVGTEEEVLREAASGERTLAAPLFHLLRVVHFLVRATSMMSEGEQCAFEGASRQSAGERGAATLAEEAFWLCHNGELTGPLIYSAGLDAVTSREGRSVSPGDRRAYEDLLRDIAGWKRLVEQCERRSVRPERLEGIRESVRQMGLRAERRESEIALEDMCRLGSEGLWEEALCGAMRADEAVRMAGREFGGGR
jgi:hypothetical protein